MNLDNFVWSVIFAFLFGSAISFYLCERKKVYLMYAIFYFSMTLAMGAYHFGEFQ